MRERRTEVLECNVRDAPRFHVVPEREQRLRGQRRKKPHRLNSGVVEEKLRLAILWWGYQQQRHAAFGLGSRGENRGFNDFKQ